jgi:hypothetical protein
MHRWVYFTTVGEPETLAWAEAWGPIIMHTTYVSFLSESLMRCSGFETMDGSLLQSSIPITPLESTTNITAFQIHPKLGLNTQQYIWDPKAEKRDGKLKAELYTVGFVVVPGLVGQDLAGQAVVAIRKHVKGILKLMKLPSAKEFASMLEGIWDATPPGWTGPTFGRICLRGWQKGPGCGRLPPSPPSPRDEQHNH